jgi:hypothetical protein
MVSSQSNDKFWQGLFARYHPAIWKDELHRLHADELFHEGKSTSDRLSLARKQIQSITPFVLFDPVGSFSTNWAILIVDEHGSFFFTSSIHSQLMSP